MKNTVTILAGRTEEARKAIIKLTKKAHKYGVPFSASVGPVYQEERRIETFEGRSKKVMVNVRDVTITGETPKVGEYEFIASVEFTPAGNFVDTPPGVEVPTEYRETNDRCEHCNHKRNRKNVYVVRSVETGEFVQVGRTCLRDFLGIDDPKHIIGAFKFWRLITGSGNEDGFDGFGRAEWTESLESLLAKTNTLIRLYGWASKGNAAADDRITATVERLFGTYGDDKVARSAREELRAEYRESDETLAQEVIDWVRSSTDTNDYFHNLRVAFSDDLVFGTRRVGLAISAVASFHRAQERELKRVEFEKVNKNSAHQGTIKERLKSLTLTVTMIRAMGDNGFGPSELIKMVDTDGNLFAWFTGSNPRFETGSKLVADATVKAHNEYGGVLETQLTRVTVREAQNV